ncbi:TetR/AcrR family transcriptional regulator [Sphingopyxis fribergensis]|nr:helix-turn-helix domain-containing protein [Sphingopyxis fribergensis]
MESCRAKGSSPARRLFGSKGFHTATTAELATEASVCMGQIYRRFSSKSDIILSIVEENARARVAEMHGIFDTIERNERSMFDALKAITAISLQNGDGGLSYEILAEACRNASVAERIETLFAFYRVGVRRLVTLTRPDVSPAERDTYVDIMMACFIGLGYRTADLYSVDVARTAVADWR